MTEFLKFIPAEIRIATCRAIYEGAPASLRESAQPAIEAAAPTVDSLVDSARKSSGLTA